jgi:hypothetical protein
MGVARKQIDDLIYARGSLLGPLESLVLGGFSPPPLDDHGPYNGNLRVEQGVPGGSKKKFDRNSWMFYTQPWQLSS